MMHLHLTSRIWTSLGLAVICLLLPACQQEDDPPDPMTPGSRSSEARFDWAWASPLNGTSNEDEIDALAADGQQNVFISGKFEETLTINDSLDLISRGKADIMVVKYNREGRLQWVKQFGGLGEDNIFDADCDSEGNLILSGYFQHTIQVGHISLTSIGGLDMVVMKLDPDGEVLWANSYGSPENDGGNEVSISQDGRIIVGAESLGNFEGMSNPVGRDAYVLCLDPAGNTRWIRGVQGPGDARSKSIAVDAIGNVYLGGDYKDENHVQTPDSTVRFLNSDGLDAYLVAFDKDGNYRWVKNWGGGGNDICKGLVSDSNHDLYAVGGFGGMAQFNNRALISTGMGNDLFIWKMDESGETLWLRQIKSSKNLLGAELAVDPRDNLYFGLGISTDVECQSGLNQFEKVSSCSELGCPIAIKYTPNGVLAAHISAGQSSEGRLGEIAISGNVAYFDCAFTGGPLSFNQSHFTSLNNTKDALLVSLTLE